MISPIDLTVSPRSQSSLAPKGEVFKAIPRESPSICQRIARVVRNFFCFLVAWFVYRKFITGDEARTIDETARGGLRALGGEDVAFKTEDDVLLEGMYFQPDEPIGKTVLLCLGNNRSYERFSLPMVTALLNRGCSVLVFNYRGFGRSEGKASEEGFKLDAEAAYQYLIQERGAREDSFVVWGYSMGTSPAVDLAAHHAIDVVLDRYFSSMAAVAKDQGGWIAKAIFHWGKAAFETKDSISSIRGRAFLFRGDQDLTMLPHHQETMRKRFEKAGVQAEFHVGCSNHLHYGSDFWFHPDNIENRAIQEALERFF